MEKRNSVLRPLTIDELQVFAIEICNFFSPGNYQENCKQLEIIEDKHGIMPLTLGNLLNYLKRKTGIDAWRYWRHIDIIIQKFLNSSFLISVGISPIGSPPFNHCYYAIIELTKIQKSNLFWLGNILEHFKNCHTVK